MAHTRKRPWTWPALAAALALAALPACFNGDSGGSGGGGPATANEDALVEALSTQNVIDLHDETSDAYDADCVKCHGTKTDEVALDGTTPMAHAIMMPFANGATANEKCVWCHPKVRLQFRNPTQNTHTDDYALYADPRPPLQPDLQLATVREDINHFEAGAIRKPYNPAANCVACHGTNGVASKHFYVK